MKKWSVLFLLPLLALACRSGKVGLTATPETMERARAAIAAGQVTYERYRPDSVQRPDTYAFQRVRDYEVEDYLPDTLHPEYLPLRNVRVNFHVMNSADTVYDFYGATAVDYSSEVVYYTNMFNRDNPKNWLNVDSIVPPALPTHINLVLVNDPETGKPAVYEHYDEKLYGYLHKGPKRNRGSMEVIKKYNVREREELNIYWMGPPRENIPAKRTSSTTGSGIYLGTAIKMTDVLSKDVPAWGIRKVFAHEVGHALNLHHAWTRNDGCDDTPTHANNSWKAKERGPGLTSNNLMDYSPNQEALTPCQIARMHALLADVNARQRGWVEPNWCDYQPERPVLITEGLTLNGARDYAADLVVKSGATLTINNRVHLPEGASIKVEPGANLILGPGAVLHNDCGGQWAGIQIGTLPDGFTGRVETAATATLLNVAP